MSTVETVHIVDDDAGIRDALRMLLESFGFTVRAHENAVAFLAAAPGPAGCVLTDIRMPGIDGLQLQKRLNEHGIMLPVIVMTGQGDIPLAVRAMKAGAVDFLEKPFADEQLLLDAVNRALERSRQLQEVESAAAAAAGRIATLTPRESEVLDLLVTGLPTKAIASQLGASPRTIEVHRARVFEKLRARNLPELVRLVLAAGRTQPGLPA